MARIAERGLSKHATKGYRISIGKKPDGGYRTFWLGHNRVVAEYHADQLRGRFDGMQQEGRDLWTDADVGVVKRCPDSILLLDDVSRVFKNSKARDIFLAALGNESGRDGARQISYHIGRRQQTITFTGGIIATANSLPYGDETVSALYSRTQPLRWTPSTQQVEAMIRWSVKDGWKDIAADEALSVAERVIELCRRMSRAPEMRLVHEHALPYYAAKKRGLITNSWEDHLLSSICGIVKISHTQVALTRDQSTEHDRRLAAELLAKHQSTLDAANEWFEKSGGKSLRTLQRHAAQLRIAE